MSEKQETSVADAVEQYLAKEDATELDIPFNDEFDDAELATIINTDRLNQLLTSCDLFLTQTQNEIVQFEDLPNFEQKKTFK